MEHLNNKKIIKKIGARNFRLLVMCMMREKPLPADVPEPGQDGRLIAATTLKNVMGMIMAARIAYGASRLLVATKACEFIRMVTGGDETEICIAGGYYCQDCQTQPVHDFKWWLCENTGELGGWFCAANGCAYDKGCMAGLMSFVDKKDKEKSFVVKTRMPSGKTGNLFSAIKVVNMIRLGEFPFSDEDIRRHKKTGKIIKS